MTLTFYAVIVCYNFQQAGQRLFASAYATLGPELIAIPWYTALLSQGNSVNQSSAYANTLGIGQMPG
jgi:hypothetical protein